MNNTYMESDQSYFSWFDSSSGAEGQLSSQFFWKSKEKPVPSKKTLDYLILPTAGPLNFQTFRRLWSCIIKMLVSQIRRKISERNSSHGRFHYLAKVAKSRRVFSNWSHLQRNHRFSCKFFNLRWKDVLMILGQFISKFLEILSYR